jgi:phosphopantetheinyl transferase (holo-ACP synthase)
MLSIVDIAASVVFKMPYFTVIGAIGIDIVEVKSVFENLKQHEKSVEEVQKTLQKLFENRESIQALITFLNTQNRRKNHATKRTPQQQSFKHSP